MNEIILDDIPFQIDFPVLMKKLHVKEGSAYLRDLKRIAAQAQAIARPKAMYKVAFIESRGDGWVVIDGVKLTSRVLQVNLEGVQRVFPYLATCGTELEDWANGIGDLLQRYWGETINEMALRAAMRVLNDHVEERYRPGKTSSMSPGSLEDWPIQQQRPLFAILGDPKQAIGVELSDSLLMIPTKSVSGIRFATETSFESCLLCPRERCPSRKAAYDPGLYERKYARRG